VTQDFAAATMMRLIALGLRAQDIDPPPVPDGGTARVPLDAKRAVLARIVANHGVGTLLRIPDAIAALKPEPTVRALIVAQDPSDLFSRWTRLERFIHSRHRVEWRADAGGTYRLAHHAHAAGEPPRAEESLLVYALLTVLVETVLGRAVTAGPAGASTPWRRDGRWTEARAPDRGFDWTIGIGVAAVEAPSWISLSKVESSLPEAVRALFASDPARSWTLGTLAKAFATSPRSLQRTLAGRGTSITRIAGELRAEAAARLLVEAKSPLAEIGFICGFSDQAHFTRSFKRLAGCTPARYRDSFSLKGVSRRLFAITPDRS